jgi:hypothetical protein
MRSLILACAATLLIGAPANARRFTDAAIGLSIEEPNGWHVVPSSSIEQSQSLPNDAESKAALRKFAPTPRFGLIRDQAYEGVATTVTIGTAAADPSVRQSGARFLQATLPFMDRFASDVKILAGPQTVTLAGESSGYMAANFTLKIGGKPYSVAAETWAIPRDKDFIFVTAVYPANEDVAGRAAVKKIANSIQLSN